MESCMNMRTHMGIRPRPAQVARPQQCAARRAVAPINAVKDVFMPALSSTMTEGKIVSWLKSPGDKIEKGEPIVVVESDKADMDVEAFDSGILGAIVVPEGGVASVGSPIAFIAESEAEVEEAKSKAGGNGTAPPAKKEPEPAPAQAEAPKAEAAAPAPAKAEPAPAPAMQAPAEASVAAPAAPVQRSDGRIVATPYAKRLAKDLGVDITRIAGTGPGGRITASDIERAAGKSASPAPAAAAPVASAAAPAAAAPAPAPAAPVKDTTVSELRGTTTPFTTLEQAVVRNMNESLKTPVFRVSMNICTDKLDALYKELKPRGVTMSALLNKAVGVALADHPRLFASCTPDGKGITYNENVNISNAVAMPDGGLITPVIKDADKTDIYQISRNWADLVKRARAKKLSPDEYNSGYFTISNLGMFGVDSFDAVLPPGQAGILAVGASAPTVVATPEGLFGVKKMMNVNLTADHRIVYGAHGAEFLVTLKHVIESPEVLLK